MEIGVEGAFIDGVGDEVAVGDAASFLLFDGFLRSEAVSNDLQPAWEGAG
jgi:hypothetical protein